MVTMDVRCTLHLPGREEERTLALPPDATRESLLAALGEGGRELFVVADGKMLLPGQCLEGVREVTILPVLDGG